MKQLMQDCPAVGEQGSQDKNAGIPPPEPVLVT